MFSKFSEDAQKALILARKEMRILKHPYVGSEHLLLAILSMKELKVTNHLKLLGLTYDKFKDELIRVVGIGKTTNDWFLYTPLLKRVLETAMLNSKENKESEVSVTELFLSLLEEGEGIAIRLLMGMNIDIDRLYQEFSTSFTEKKITGHKKLLIEEFSVNLNKRIMSNEIDPVIGRETELKRMIEILCRRTKNNPLLLGEAGVGKTAIVEELARQIVNDNVPRSLKGKVILSLSMASLVAGTKYRGEFEERVGKILKEIHKIPAPKEIEDWEIYFNRKVDHKIKMYEECPVKYENGQAFIDYINAHRYLLSGRPRTYQHGDYHIGNMMIGNDKRLYIIDFNRNDFGDPWEEFNRIVWCAQKAPLFASGMVNGYFDDNVPMGFWRLLALYISSNTLSSVYSSIVKTFSRSIKSSM